MSDKPARDPARARYVTIQSIRFVATALAVVGILALNGRGLPRAAGFVLAPIGIVAAFVVPTLLARRWRTRR
jgi:hypothetical protein